MSLPRVAHRSRGLLVLLMTYAVLAAAVVIVPWSWGAGSARAAEEDVLLHLELDRVSPAIARPGGEVRLEGTLRNLGPDPVSVHGIRVSTAYRGLDTRGAVQEWGESGDVETPIVLGEDHIGVAIAPGSTVHWFVEVPEDGLDPGFEFATLPVRLEVLSPGPTPDPVDGSDGEDAREDETAGPPVPGTEVRSYLPWISARDSEFNPVQVAWLAPLTLPGDAGLVDPDDATRAQAWDRAIGPGSRTQALLDGLADTEATFVVDPALLDPLSPVASLAEVVQLPGDEETPTETPEEPEPTGPEPTGPQPTGAPTGPEPTGPQPTGPQPTGPGATDPGATGPPSTDPEATGSAVGGSSDPEATSPDHQAATTGTSAPGEDATERPPDDQEAPTSGPGESPEPTQEPDPEPPAPPTTQEAVAELTERIVALPEGRRWWLPVGDTDVGALLKVGAEVPEIADLVGRPPAAGLPAPGRTDVAWPVAQTVSDTTVTSLVEVWSTAGGSTGTAGPDNGNLGGVVLPGHVFEDALLTGSAVRRHATGPPLIGYDERLSGIVAASGGAGLHGPSTQRFLAESLAVYQEGPATDRSLVVAVPRSAEVDADSLRELTAAASSAPWLQDTTASRLMTDRTGAPSTTVHQDVPEWMAAEGAGGTEPAPQEPATDPSTDESPTDEQATDESTTDRVPGNVLGELSAYTLPEESPLTASSLQRIDLIRTRVAGVSEVVPGSEQARRTWMRVLDRQFSTGWRNAPQEWQTPLETAETLASEILNGLTINPTTINLYADEGLMQITVVNELPIPIEGLRMQVDPGNARLRVLEQPDPITIGPESRATVQFRAKAVAAGQVPLHTSLSTPNGTQIGTAEETVVRVQPTGVWIYWLLGGVAGVILVLGLWRALRPPGSRRDSAETTDQSEQNVATPGSDAETP